VFSGWVWLEMKNVVEMVGDGRRRRDEGEEEKKKKKKKPNSSV
jgi:hypothetical protein